jgi:hypothetical protein
MGIEVCREVPAKRGRELLLRERCVIGEMTGRAFY